MFIRFLRNLIIACFISSIFVQTYSQPLKILPLGNSITKGVFCTNGNVYSCETMADSEIIGYRYALYSLLLNSGYDFTFIGNEIAGFGIFPSTELARHAGYPGIRSDLLANKLNENGNYLLNSTEPDIVLLEIGTNDISAGYTTAQYVNHVNNILNEIDEYEASSGKPVLVFLSKIIKFTQGTLYGNNVPAFNTSLTTLYNQRVSAGDHVVLLDAGITLINLIEPSGDMMDQLHPNQAGYDKMAAQWFQAINNYNSSPVSTQIPNQQISEGNSFSVISLDNYVSDVEDADNMIVWTVSPEPQNYTVTINANRQAIITPKNADWNGSEQITFVATDRGKTIPGLKKRTSVTTTFTVTAVNDEPVITGQTRIPVTTEETSYTVVLSDLNVTDIDNPLADLTVQILSGTNYTNTGNSVTPAVNFSGNLSVNVRVNDLSSSSQVYTFTLSVSAINDPPVINSATARSCNEDTPLKLRLTDYQVTDPDNYYPADFSLIVGNGQNYSHSGDTIIPYPDYYGPLNVSIMVRDLHDQSNTFIHEITVEPVNDPPVLILPTIQSVVEGNLLEMQLGAYDPDESDLLQITAVSIPTWLTHNSVSSKLSGTPLHQHVGINSITLRVNDSHMSVDSTFVVEVLLGTGLNDYESKGYAVYPNPVSETIHIKLKPGAYECPIFRLYNLNGTVVVERQISTDEFSVDAEEYSISPGVYIYELSEKHMIFTKGKLVVTPSSSNR